MAMARQRPAPVYHIPDLELSSNVLIFNRFTMVLLRCRRFGLASLLLDRPLLLPNLSQYQRYSNFGI
jgi:hypothetical protein